LIWNMAKGSHKPFYFSNIAATQLLSSTIG